MKHVLFSLLLLAFSSAAALEIYDGRSLQSISLDTVLDQVHNGHILIVSELHGVEAQHEFQRQVIRELARRNFKVNVGIEHISHLEQNILDAYLKQQLSEADLVHATKVSKFKNWREQLLLPLTTGGWSYGINAPRWLTSKINSVGYDLLNSLEKNILPADFSLGSDAYLQRFLALSGLTHPVPGIEKSFEAQSAWDDTSAWQIAQRRQNDPHSVFVVLFGEFHVNYGGGLPDRLTQRGVHEQISFSQICRDGLNPTEIEAQLKPHSVYGPRADYLVLSQCREGSN